MCAIAALSNNFIPLLIDSSSINVGQRRVQACLPTIIHTVGPHAQQHGGESVVKQGCMKQRCMMQTVLRHPVIFFLSADAPCSSSRRGADTRDKTRQWARSTTRQDAPYVTRQATPQHVPYVTRQHVPYVPTYSLCRLCCFNHSHRQGRQMQQASHMQRRSV